MSDEKKNLRTVEFKPSYCGEHEKQDPETGEPIKDADGKVIMQPATFEGVVVLASPSFDERMELLESVGIKADAKGRVELGNLNAFGVLRKLVSATKKFYVEVKLKRLEDGAEFKTFDDLAHDAGCDKIISEVAYAIRQGFKPGKNSPAP